MAIPETTPCQYKPYIGPQKNKWMPGHFHQWGSELAPTEGDGNYTVGIIEDNQTRAIVTVTPDRVHFGSAL